MEKWKNLTLGQKIISFDNLPENEQTVRTFNKMFNPLDWAFLDDSVEIMAVADSENMRYILIDEIHVEKHVLTKRSVCETYEQDFIKEEDFLCKL